MTLTSLEILPFRLPPVTTQVYLVSIKFLIGKVTVGLVDFQIEYGAVHTISISVVLVLQAPTLQVREPEPAWIEGSEIIEGIALFRIRADDLRVAMPLARSLS